MFSWVGCADDRLDQTAERVPADWAPIHDPDPPAAPARRPAETKRRVLPALSG